MAGLPSQHPTLSLHLADDSLTPLITSSRSRAHLESLTSLTTSALTSRAAAQRVGMGNVERIMIEYPAPAAAALVLQSYLHVPPCDSTTTAPTTAAPTDNNSSRTVRGEDDDSSSKKIDAGRQAHDSAKHVSEETSSSNIDSGAADSRKAASGKATKKDEDAGDELHVPRLVGVVVAGTLQEASEAKKAAARLERIGREFQSQWVLSCN